jgi:hypothetical protein
VGKQQTVASGRAQERGNSLFVNFQDIMKVLVDAGVQLDEALLQRPPVREETVKKEELVVFRTESEE